MVRSRTPGRPHRPRGRSRSIGDDSPVEPVSWGRLLPGFGLLAQASGVVVSPVVWAIAATLPGESDLSLGLLLPAAVRSPPATFLVRLNEPPAGSDRIVICSSSRSRSGCCSSPRWSLASSSPIRGPSPRSRWTGRGPSSSPCSRGSCSEGRPSVLRSGDGSAESGGRSTRSGSRSSPPRVGRHRSPPSPRRPVRRAGRPSDETSIASTGAIGGPTASAFPSGSGDDRKPIAEALIECRALIARRLGGPKEARRRAARRGPATRAARSADPGWSTWATGRTERWPEPADQHHFRPISNPRPEVHGRDG